MVSTAGPEASLEVVDIAPKAAMFSFCFGMNV